MDAAAAPRATRAISDASSSLTAMTLSGVAVVAVDADDTLWPTDHLYTDAIVRFAELLAPWYPGPGEDLPAKLSAHHNANASCYGFGALAFGQSMLEYAAKILPDDAPCVSVVEGVAEAVSIIHQDPARPYPWAEDALRGFVDRGLRVVMITKGVHSEQMAKLRRSGLTPLLKGGVVVVANKDAASYRGVIASLGTRPEGFLMCGDSVDSDVSPVLSCGAQAVLIASADTAAAAQLPESVPVVGRLIDVLDLLPVTTQPGSGSDQQVAPSQRSGSDQQVAPSQRSGSDQQVAPSQRSGSDQQVAPSQRSGSDQPVEPLRGVWLRLQDDRYGVAVTAEGLDIESVHDVDVEPVHGVSSRWQIRIVAHDADTSIGVVSHAGRAESLPAARWRRILGGAGFAVEVAARLEPGTRHLVLVLGSTGSAALNVEAVEAVETDNDKTTCYVVGRDGKAEPYAGPGR